MVFESFEAWKSELEKICKEISDSDKFSKDYLFKLNEIVGSGLYLTDNIEQEIQLEKSKKDKKQEEKSEEVTEQEMIGKKLEKITSVQEANLADYVFMPSHSLYVAKERILHRNNWYETHKEAHKQDARMLNLREFADFLLLLKSGKAEDGLGNKISKSDLQTLYLDITEVRDPYRAEWLDAKFEDKNGNLHLNYNHRTKCKKLEATNSEPLETCVMKDCKVELSSFNKQGMPTKEGTDFNYWYPVDCRVAWFGAVADWAYLGCNGNPDLSNGGLGVRLAREKNKK